MFHLSDSLSEITSLFDLSLVLNRTLAQWRTQQMAKSKSEIIQCTMSNQLFKTKWNKLHQNVQRVQESNDYFAILC